MAGKKKTKKEEKVTTDIVVIPEERAAGNYLGVNQYTEDVDPRQALFLALYYDRESPTWGNAKQSAIKAGYSEGFACTITYEKPKWWSDYIGQQNIAGLIEQHVHEVMSLPVVQQAMGAFGPLEKTEIIKEEIGVYKTGPKKGQPKYRNVKVRTPIMVANLGVAKVKNDLMKIAAPAHNPEMYGKKVGGNKFIFNMAPDREKYA